MKRILNLLLLSLLVMSIVLPDTAIAKKKHEISESEKHLQYLNFDWWNKFNDPILVSYINKLYNKNHDLKIASLKVKENEKIVKLSFSNELPQIGFDGNYRRIMTSGEEQRGPDFVYKSYTQNHFYTPLTASYEIDIWGQNRLKTKSIEQELLMSEQDERSTYIMLTSSFASNYYNLVKAKKMIEVQEKLVEVQSKIKDMMQKKFDCGLCNEFDVIDEDKLLAIYESQLSNLVKTKTLLANQLAMYLSNNDENIDTIDFDDVDFSYDVPSKFDATIIEKRPDYIWSEQNIKKYGFDVRIARKDLLPKFIIFGQIGLNVYTWSDFFKKSAQFANAGIMPSFDIFAGGRKLSMLKLKKYEYDEAVEKYQKVILSSIKDVNDSLINIKDSKENYSKYKKCFELEVEKRELAFRKNDIGANSKLDLLYGQEQELLVQKEEVSAKINCIISIIGLYKATGGQNLFDLNNHKDENI